MLFRGLPAKKGQKRPEGRKSTGFLAWRQVSGLARINTTELDRNGGGGAAWISRVFLACFFFLASKRKSYEMGIFSECFFFPFGGSLVWEKI